MKRNAFVFLGLSIWAIQTQAQENVASLSNRENNTVTQLFFTGLREKLAENYVLAANDFGKVIALDPKNHAAYFELAQANLRLGKLSEAEHYAKQAILLQESNVWYWRILGEIYKRNNQMEQLVAVLDELIKLEPNKEEYYFDKASAQILAEQPEAAKKTYVDIEAKFGASNELTRAKDRLQNRNNVVVDDNSITKLLEGNQADTKSYVYAANLFLQKNNVSEALNVLLKAQKLEPNNYEINLLLADVYRKQNNNEQAFASLKRAFEQEEMPLMDKMKIMASLFSKISQPLVASNLIDLSKILVDKNPNDAKVLALYGDVLYQQNKFKEALTQYQAALKLNDQVYVVWEQVINLQTLLGQYTEAIKVGDEALTVYPNQGGLYYYMAYAQFKIHKFNEAQSNLKTALTLAFDNASLQAQVYALQGDIYLNQNNFAQAKVSFEKALEIEPDNYMIMNNYAYYLALKNEDLAKAEKYAEKASTAMPKSASIADTYAFILFKQQKYTQAKSWIEKALQNNHNQNGVYFERYGDILFMLGDNENAFTQWQKAKEAGNGSELLNKKINEKKYFK
ncbi:tetratricopeptide repeat protein [Pedobacter sp. MW01-1-1]|uniref:tetratricopeptide repeat protein n=1 Tax=Pedobacter sp. MW01-1-1 TaxID=3383027 RepID=UPI003FF0661A